MLDKTKSYKLVGGKFVERTPEEAARLEQRKAEQAARELAQAAREPAQPWMPRMKGKFVRVTLEQIVTLHELGSAACWFLFMGLLYENFRQRGQPFVLSIEKVTSLTGLSRANLHRALIRLETCGLIAIVRKPPQPPQIKILDIG